MNRKFKKVLYGIVFLLIALLIIGLGLAYFPVKSKVNHKGISQERATQMRNENKELHHLITTSDNETLFLRQWNPDVVDSTKKDVAVLLFHGITAYSLGVATTIYVTMAIPDEISGLILLSGAYEGRKGQGEEIKK